MTGGTAERLADPLPGPFRDHRRKHLERHVAAEETGRIEDGIAAGKAWGEWVNLFVRRA